MLAKTTLVRPGTIAELGKRLLLARADEGDATHPHGRAVFWIGAGTSVSAGLPSGRALAGRLALRIAVKLGYLAAAPDSEDLALHEEAFAALKRAGEIGSELTLGSAYGGLFARLDATQQRDFIRRVIVKTNRRQINWSHLAIGELVRQRIVHTLLTTNFDDLLLDGLVRCDQLPAIIDGVESLNRMDPRPPVPQLVYLHGSQHTYSPRNSTEAVLGVRDLAQAQGGLFGLLQQCSALVIVGYAGNAGEGVMELLLRVCASLPELPIFWVAHGQQDSLSAAAFELLCGTSNSRLIPGQDSDLFFRELLRETRIGVPAWFREPVDHLLHLADRISVDVSPASSELLDEVNDFRQRLKELQHSWARVGAENVEMRELRQLILSDNYAEVWRRLKGRTLTDIVMLQMRADSAYELGRRGLEDILPQALRDGSAALRQLHVGSPEWALAQDRLGDALATMGERGDSRAVRDAIDAYDQALTVHTREAMPIKWASTRNNQGLAHLVLGELGDARALDAALAAFRDALEIYRREASPVEWASAQGNLANALQVLGKRGNPKRLQEAVDAYAEVLTIHTREQMPIDWAMTTCDRASALVALGELGNEHALLDAVKALEDASGVVTRESLPSHWAKITSTKGAALLALGQRGHEDSLRQAISAFRDALKVRVHKATSADRATTTGNLGAALLALGSQSEQAMEVLSSAVEVLSGEMYPQSHRLNIESLAQRVFDELWRVAMHAPAPVPGMARSVSAGSGPEVAATEVRSRILVVEDDTTYQIIIDDLLKKCGLNLELRICTTGAEALCQLADYRPDLVILDLQLPDMSGQEVLVKIKSSYPCLAVLIYSGDKGALSKLQEEHSGPTSLVTLMPKNQNYDEFIRLVPTLFKRRQRDGVVATRSVSPHI